MARKFNIPIIYRSPLISTLKHWRQQRDVRKKDLSPAVLDLGILRFKIARHFGFCYGVENAIETAYRALDENPEKRVYLLSEMIHNPHVNNDLIERGVKFILSTDGRQLIPFEELRPDDIVIVPAFGTTVELLSKLESLGLNPLRYNATCPFVEKVWKKADALGSLGFSIIIHGKHTHEETRATFSHARRSAQSVVVRDLVEARNLCKYIQGQGSQEEFEKEFAGRYSEGFQVTKHLERVGVVNQTTMLAEETQSITEAIRLASRSRYGESNLEYHFADTRDTLCYATSENQAAVKSLITSGGDLALVVGGYNSSNTSHLVELCEVALPTFYIKDASEILDADRIRHFDMHSRDVKETTGWLPTKTDGGVTEIILTAGASCPDALVDEVILRVAGLVGLSDRVDSAIQLLLAS